MQKGHLSQFAPASTECPLCNTDKTREFCRDKIREYLWCADCDLVFVPPTWHPTPEAARARYDLHRNSPGDMGYRAYLQRLITALSPHLRSGDRGLDFGCGPGPVLSLMLEAAGHPMTLYDIHYAPHPEALSCTYAFVTATEVIEHLQTPAATLETMWACVAAGGVLAIMTQLRPHKAAFERWHYKNDSTHVAFFSVETFQWLATRFQASVEFAGDGVILLHKRGDVGG